MSEMSGMDKYKFRRALEQIEEAAGRGTELVSVYIPPGRPISDVTNYLRAELSQSSVIKNLQSQVPSKHRMGGQSARRFERGHDIAVYEWYKKIGDLMTEAFLNLPDLKGIIIGGPGYSKEEFATGDYLHHELKKKVLPTFLDTGYTDEYGLRELVEKSREILSGLDLMREKSLVH